MDSILIKPGKKEELEFLKTMAAKMGFEMTIISEEDWEDLGLLKAMEESKRHGDEYVDEETVMRKLHGIAKS